MSKQILIKCLRQGGRSVHSFLDAQGKNGWDVPQNGNIGQWKGPVDGQLKPHHNGLHLAKKDFLIDWITGHHFIAETDGETVEGLDCVIARKARLTEHLPINAAKLSLFCDNQLALLPEILDSLDVYPKITSDVKKCIDAISENGISNAHKSLSSMKEYKFVRQNANRLSYDELHSIEYQACTETSKTCLDTIVGVYTMAENGSNIAEFAKVISNKVAKSMDALYRNYHFMNDLCNEHYDHQDEVKSMGTFLAAKALISQKEVEQIPIQGFFRTLRHRQNREILPALGINA